MNNTSIKFKQLDCRLGRENPTTSAVFALCNTVCIDHTGRACNVRCLSLQRGV
jgi:hypothetical protein